MLWSPRPTRGRTPGTALTKATAIDPDATPNHRLAEETYMPVTNIVKDIDNRTLTISAAFAAPVSRVWRVYADPRQLELVWGPPDLPRHLRRPRPASRRPDDLLHDLPRGGEGSMAGGRSRRSTSRGRSASTTASPMRPQPEPRPSGVAERLHFRAAGAAGRWPPSAAPTRPSRICRSCSTWAWRRARPWPSTRSTPCSPGTTYAPRRAWSARAGAPRRAARRGVAGGCGRATL